MKTSIHKDNIITIKYLLSLTDKMTTETTIKSNLDMYKEINIHKFWEENKIFEKQNNNNFDKTFTFYDGPPFMTGLPHYGHILAGLIKDTITRHQYSKGYNVPRNNGSDCHGLPIEFEIEKKLGIKTTKQVLEYGIKNYNEECKSIVFSCKDKWKEIMGKLGRWIDFDNGYATLTKEFMNSVWWVFSELYKKNRIYEGLRIMPYSTSCGTPLSNFETSQNYKEINDDSLYLKFKIINDEESYLWCNNNKNCYFMVWTTTPWTLPSNYLLAINKNINYNTISYYNKNTNTEELLIVAENQVLNIRELLGLKDGLISIHNLRGEELIGLKYEPLFNYNNLHNDYKVIHGDFVSEESGTGVVHLCPSHGEDDYKACLENNIITKESKLFMTLNINGYITDVIPEIEGMFYKNYVIPSDKKDKKKKEEKDLDMNTWVIIKLKEKGLYLLKKTIKHNYPFCWRSDTPLIYRAVSSHFVKVNDMQEKLVKLNEQINWYPKHVGEKRFASWIGNARDWGISRNRFWGTPIPIWRSEDGDEICVSSSYELEKLLNMPENSINDLHRDTIDDYIIIKNGKEYKRLSAIFDCWFESGAMPYGSLNQIGIVETLRQSSKGIELDINNCPFIETNDGKIHKILPADFIAEGIDQTRGWFYTLLVLSASIFDMIPFKNVIVNGIILAQDGLKMSKRLKNYPDPEMVLEKYSSDCLRLYLLASQASIGESLKFNEEGVVTAMKDIIIKIKNGSLNFLKEYATLYHEKNREKPIYDLFSISSNGNKNYENLQNSLSLWFVNKYENHRNKFMYFMNNYNLKQSIEILYKVVEDLNNGFIKMGRYLLKGNDTFDNCKEGLSTLYFVLKYIANDFKSIIPFFSEMMYFELNKISVLHENILITEKMPLKHDSIHLCQYDEYPVLSQEQIDLANDFDIIYEIIKGIHKIRSKNNKNAKKPIKYIYLLGEESIKDKIKEEYFDYIYSECNVIEINKVNENEINVIKTLSPVKSLFFRKHGKDIKSTFDEILTKNNQELEEIILNNTFNGFEITIDEFNIDYNINFIDETKNINSDIKIEEIKINNSKIFVIGDLLHDEETDKLYYAKLFATSVQRMRKNAKLHPWNHIIVYWKGVPKYTFNEAMMVNMNKTIKMQVLEYNEEFKDKIFYQENCDKTNLTILFENIV